jgi:hypothetical protein
MFLLVLSAYLPHTWPNQFVSKSTCPIVHIMKTILLWNVLDASHSVMECDGYKPFCYGMCWVQSILLWTVLGTTSACAHFTLPIQKIWVNPIDPSHTSHLSPSTMAWTRHECVCVCVCVWERERERERETFPQGSLVRSACYKNIAWSPTPSAWEQVVFMKYLVW